MKATITDNLRKYLLGNRLNALAGVISSLHGDLRELLANYMKLDGDVSVTADLDDVTGDAVFRISFSAHEIYDAGTVLKE